MSQASLGEYDFIMVIDCSSSMDEPNKKADPKGTTRWEAMKESVIGFAKDICAIDADGIGLVQLGGQGKHWDGVGVDEVRAILNDLKPRGSTPLDAALTTALQLAGKSAKKDFIVVFTDGTPDDRNAAAEVIRKASNRQDTDDALTILFIQVGDDANATAYLKTLDDDLKGCKFDIVDAKTIDEANKFLTTTELIEAAIAD